MKKGIKYDKEKPRWSLLPWGPVSEIVKVMTFGAKKYSDNAWQNLPNYRDRYFSAMMRHITAWWGGEKFDKESGLNHLAHAGCCLLFLLWEDHNEHEGKAEGSHEQ